MSTGLAFSIEYASEDQALAAACSLGDACEAAAEVEAWRLRCDTGGSGHTLLTGVATVSPEDPMELAQLATWFSEIGRSALGFVGGYMGAIPANIA